MIIETDNNLSSFDHTGKNMQKTKIVATLGPSTDSVEKVYKLIMAGLDVARINLSHGNRANHQRAIDIVKRAREKAGKPTAILLDNRGPEIRIGELAEPLHLTAGQRFIITTDETSRGANRVTTTYPHITRDVDKGQKILLDDGKIILVAEKVTASDIICTVQNAGILTSRKRVALPESIVKLPALSEADIADISFGVEQDVDFIAASFIRKVEDVWEIRNIIEQHGGNIAIISKIENQQGVDNVEAILEASDGIMVARGDLGVELPAEKVPIIQKKIIRMANSVGKPVITATQMLESMITNPTPTRAEASDVTNAIFDGTDAVMLSAETAIGQYPVEAVQFLRRCAVSAEAALDYETLLVHGLRHSQKTITDSISYACCAIARNLQASAIITSTSSGSTARMVSRHHPSTPIVAVSTNEDSIRKLQLVRGVTTVRSRRASTMDEQLDISVKSVKRAGLIRNGDLVVITAGMPLGERGTTNLIKVKVVADICFRGQGASSGKGEGTVQIITKSTDLKKLAKDAIVVLQQSDDTILKELASTNGIIIEKAQISAHTTAVARERKIPVVYNVPGITKTLENGQIITINGSSGQICYGRSFQ